jgi:hypothetical protein
MSKLRDGGGLTDEAAHESRAAGESWIEHLEGDLLLGRLLSRSVDDSNTS